MRTLITLVLIFITSHSLFGQIVNNTELSDFSNVYNNALRIYCDSFIEKNCNSIMVEYETLTTCHLPNKIGNVEIKLIEYKQLISLSTKLNNLELIRVVPIRFEKGFFFVNILQYRVTRKGKKLEYSLLIDKGASIKYRFECDSQSFVFDKVE